MQRKTIDARRVEKIMVDGNRSRARPKKMRENQLRTT